MKTSTQREHDIAELSQLDADYLSSDQNMDIARYEEILAEDFTAALMDFQLPAAQTIRRSGSTTTHIRKDL